MLILPIRTESPARDMPTANYVLIAVNMLLFLLFEPQLVAPALVAFRDRHLVFDSVAPEFHQFLTYQFMHADGMHVLGNLLFLWVFGNGVNAKMGNVPYVLFYLAGGVFAAWGFTMMQDGPSQLVGASGAIAAVTTAYLALFPRCRVTVLVWFFFFIHFFHWPAMLLIGLKVIVWDNIVAPSIGGASNIAYYAHLAGYLFGFVGAVAMLVVHAVPRDQFDILALWRRWHLRREFANTMADPEARARAQYGTPARVPTGSATQRAAEEQPLDASASLRGRIGEALQQGDLVQATGLYEELVAADPRQCLSEREQLQVAREFYRTRRFPQAAAFHRFTQAYPHSTEVTNIRLLLGIIYARDLRQYEVADKHLTESMALLKDGQRRDQCLRWLRDVRAALGRDAPELENG